MKRQVALVVLLSFSTIAALAQTTPEARARTASIRATIAGIEAECRQSAGSDWDRWYAALDQFRQNLRARLKDAADKRVAFKAAPTTAPGPTIRTNSAPQIFEWPDNADYLVPTNVERWVQERPSFKTFIDVSVWLKSKGIDLIVVPAPRIAEIYGDLIAEGAPSNRIVAPHMRRFVWELSKADVEIVDLVPVYLRNRDGGTPLYLATDGHWSDRGQQLAAAELATRLKRYPFVKTALAQPARFKHTTGTQLLWGSLLEWLTPAETTEMEPVAAVTQLTKVTTADGVPFEEPLESPVLVIGDSFTHYFQLAIAKGSGIDALLSAEINIPVSNVSSAGATTEPIREFLRRPELLRGRRVVIWIENNMAVSYDEKWNVPPLPK